MNPKWDPKDKKNFLEEKQTQGKEFPDGKLSQHRGTVGGEARICCEGKVLPLTTNETKSLK